MKLTREITSYLPVLLVYHAMHEALRLQRLFQLSPFHQASLKLANHRADVMA